MSFAYNLAFLAIIRVPLEQTPCITCIFSGLRAFPSALFVTGIKLVRHIYELRSKMLKKYWAKALHVKAEFNTAISVGLVIPMPILNMLIQMIIIGV